MGTISLTLWSVTTILCGAAASCWQLFRARAGVGLGEAGGSAPMQAILADNFPRSQRGMAISTCLVGSSLGVGLGVGFTGWARAEFGWRWAFVFAGIRGLLLAPLLMLAEREGHARTTLNSGRVGEQPPFRRTALSYGA